MTNVGRTVSLALVGAFMSSVAWAGPNIVTGPGANPECFKPWSDKTKFLQWAKKPGPYKIALVNGFVGNTWRIQMVKTAKAFAEQGIKDGVQVNSIVPGAVMTGRRRSFLEKWAPAHNMSVEDATNKFPEEAGISRYGRPEEIAELLGFMVSPAAKWMTGSSVRMDGGEVKGI